MAILFTPFNLGQFYVCVAKPHSLRRSYKVHNWRKRLWTLFFIFIFFWFFENPFNFMAVLTFIFNILNGWEIFFYFDQIRTLTYENHKLVCKYAQRVFWVECINCSLSLLLKWCHRKIRFHPLLNFYAFTDV